MKRESFVERVLGVMGAVCVVVVLACAEPPTYARPDGATDRDGAAGARDGGLDAAVGGGGKAGGSAGRGGTAGVAGAGGNRAGAGGRGDGGESASASVGGAPATGGSGNGMTGGAAATGGSGNGMTGGAAATGGVGSGMTGGAVATGGSGMTGGLGSGGSALAGQGGGAGGPAGAPGGGGGGPSKLIVSLDFVGGEASGGSGGRLGTAMGDDEIAGFKPAAHWNSAEGATGSLSTLRLSDGNQLSGANATWDVPLGNGNGGIWRIGYASAPGDVRMMNGCLNPGWTGTTPPSTPVTIVTVSGLPASLAQGYDVYVYVLGGIPDNETRTYEYAIGSSTISVSQVGPTPTTVTSPYPYKLATSGGGNYIVFKQVTGAFFTLKARPGSNSGTLRAPVNGIQNRLAVRVLSRALTLASERTLLRTFRSRRGSF